MRGLISWRLLSGAIGRVGRVVGARRGAVGGAIGRVGRVGGAVGGAVGGV